MATSTFTQRLSSVTCGEIHGPTIRPISKALENISELRICVKIEVAVPGSPSLISLTVSVDAKQHRNEKTWRNQCQAWSWQTKGVWQILATPTRYMGRRTDCGPTDIEPISFWHVAFTSSLGRYAGEQHHRGRKVGGPRHSQLLGW